MSALPDIGSGIRIYVDEFPAEGWGKWGGGGHLMANEIDALHAMARKIGLKREWFQDKRFPHYDVQRRKRALAVAAGAIEIEIGELPDDVLMRCDDGTYQRRSALLAARKARSR